MNYLLACAQRGPDSDSDDADSWKFLVTEKLRWFAAIELNEEPERWCQGFISPPNRAVFAMVALLERAKNFVRQDPTASHVVLHAHEAFLWLMLRGKQSSGISAGEYHGLLVEHGLL